MPIETKMNPYDQGSEGTDVSVVGFKEIKKYSRLELSMTGIELKDRESVVSWLRDYRPTDRGLWLSHPQKHP